MLALRYTLVMLALRYTLVMLVLRYTLVSAFSTRKVPCARAWLRPTRL